MVIKVHASTTEKKRNYNVWRVPRVWHALYVYYASDMRHVHYTINIKKTSSVINDSKKNAIKIKKMRGIKGFNNSLQFTC